MRGEAAVFWWGEAPEFTINVRKVPGLCHDIACKAYWLAEPDPVHGMQKDCLGSDMASLWGGTS